MKLALPDTAATEALGAALAHALSEHQGAVIYLQGDLGVGKTTLARGLLRALGVQGTVKSPTYTLMEPYQAGERSVLHMDLYRLNDPLELHNLGLSDFSPSNTLWLVEWPQRALDLLPAFDLQLTLQAADTGRLAEIQSRQGFGTDFWENFQREARVFAEIQP